MLAHFSDGQMVRRGFDAIKELVSDGLITVSVGEGMKLEEMDSTHVTLVCFHLFPSGFTSLELLRSVAMGVNLVTLTKILGLGSMTDEVTWSMDDADRTSLHVETFSAQKQKKSKKKASAEFDLKLVDIDRESLTVPDTEYDAIIFMRSATLMRLVKDLMKFSDSVKITVNEQGMTCAVEGENGPGKICLPNIKPRRLTTASFDCFRFPRNAADVADGDEEGEGDDANAVYVFVRPGAEAEAAEIKLEFAFRYLASFTRCTGLTPHVQLAMSMSAPLLVKYPLYNKHPTTPPPPPAPANDEIPNNDAAANDASNDAKSAAEGREARKDVKSDGNEKKQLRLTDMKQSKSAKPPKSDKSDKPEKAGGHEVGKRKKPSGKAASSAPSSSSEPSSDDIVGHIAFHLAPKGD